MPYALYEFIVDSNIELIANLSGLQHPLVTTASLWIFAVTLGQKPSRQYYRPLTLAPRVHKDKARLACARDTDRHSYIGVLIMHYHVVSDSPGGVT